MKQTFNIPEGCSTVTVEQVGNQLITTFDPEKYVPKAGDIVKAVDRTCTAFFIVESVNGKDINHFHAISNNHHSPEFSVFTTTKHSTFEKLTPEQFQSEFEKLGYIYDFETNTASKKRWRPGHKESYYSFGYEGAIPWDNDKGDRWRLKNNLVFETESERDEALIKFNNK